MRIRDALESDAEALGRLADRPVDVMVNLVHDRSVRVAVEESGDTEESDDTGDSGDTAETIGFVAFDVHGEAVHVTDFAGSRTATDRLFEEPRRFAVREGMPVEVVVADGDDDDAAAVKAAGFESDGPGPRFEGRSTTRYLLDPKED